MYNFFEIILLCMNETCVAFNIWLYYFIVHMNNKFFVKKVEFLSGINVKFSKSSLSFSYTVDKVGKKAQIIIYGTNVM